MKILTTAQLSIKSHLVIIRRIYDAEKLRSKYCRNIAVYVGFYKKKKPAILYIEQIKK